MAAADRARLPRRRRSDVADRRAAPRAGVGGDPDGLFEPALGDRRGLVVLRHPARRHDLGRRPADHRVGPVHRLARASPPYQPAEGGCRMTQKDVRPILYHCPDARSLRCLWAVEEAEIDVELRLLKFPPRAFEPDYRAVNPLMTIPSWVEDGRLMTESAAICERIAEGTPLEVRRDEGDYWAWRNWLHRRDAQRTFPPALMIRYPPVARGEGGLPP